MTQASPPISSRPRFPNNVVVYSRVSNEVFEGRIEDWGVLEDLAGQQGQECLSSSYWFTYLWLIPFFLLLLLEASHVDVFWDVV